MWILMAIGIAIVALAHTAPAPFVLDAMAGDRAVWHMPRTRPPTVYLTFDDGPNPSTTPDLLDVLAREHVRATFFLIDRHVTSETVPIVRRMFDEGHSVAVHSASRRDMITPSRDLSRELLARADRIATATGRRPCRAYRPHAGWRSGEMFTALHRIGFRLVGWSWMLWDVDIRGRTADRTVARLAARASDGDIAVLHDGDESAPRKPQPQTVEAAARLIPEWRARGLSFGVVCENEG